MRKFYEKSEIWFAVCWIIFYCVVLTPIRGQGGDESPVMTAALAAISAVLIIFVRRNHLEGKYGLNAWPKDWKRYWYFLPMWILATGNLWGGIRPEARGIPQICAVLSMALVGFVEEMIFRGFLFRAMLKEGRAITAVIVASVTFGMGHIVNLLTGQASLHTLIQIAFAIAWGFMLTMAYYKSGSMLPCIIVHSLIDVFSRFAVDSPLADHIYVGATIVTALVYCLYLRSLQPVSEEEGGAAK